MKRAIIISPAHPLRGGIAASSERLATEMQKMGIATTIFSYSLQYPSFLFPGKSQYTTDPAPAGLDIVTVINSVNPMNWWKVGKRIIAYSPDVIVVRYWLPFMGMALGTILRVAKRNRRGLKVVAITDNVVPHEGRPGDEALTRYFISAVDAFVVMSKAVEDDVKKFSNAPVRFTPHPIYDVYGDAPGRDECLKRLGLPGNRNYLLFFGFIRKYKGLDLLLDAMADEQLKNLSLGLIVAGECYGDFAPYEQQIKRLQLKGLVTVHLDYIPTSDVKYFFGSADLVVLPYRSATQSGIAQLAYHFKKPMVVTNVGGLPEVVHHEKEGYVVPVEKSALAGAIKRFFESGKRLEMEQAVADRRAEFSWTALVEKIQEVAEEADRR